MPCLRRVVWVWSQHDSAAWTAARGKPASRCARGLKRGPQEARRALRGGQGHDGGGGREPAEPLRGLGLRVGLTVPEGGLAAPRGPPRSGRPPAVPRRRLSGIMENMPRAFMTPEKALSAFADWSGAVYRPSAARGLMRVDGLSPKTARLVHVNREPRHAALVWQRRLKTRIGRRRHRCFAVLVQDEANFIHNVVADTSGRSWASGRRHVHGQLLPRYRVRRADRGQEAPLPDSRKAQLCYVRVMPADAPPQVRQGRSHRG